MKFIITTPWRRSWMIMTYTTGDGLFGMGELCRQDELHDTILLLSDFIRVIFIQNLAVWNYLRAAATFLLIFQDMLRCIMISRKANHDKRQSIKKFVTFSLSDSFNQSDTMYLFIFFILCFIPWLLSIKQAKLLNRLSIDQHSERQPWWQ